MSDKIGQKFVTKHAKWAVSFCFKVTKDAKLLVTILSEISQNNKFAVRNKTSFAGNPIRERGG
jgi:hypothetical protein